MNERRGHWYLLTGILIGAVLGLLISWWYAPVQSLAASPASLRADFKDEYRYMIAASYAATGNLGRARARLALLEDKNTLQALRDQSQRMLDNNTAPSVIHNVAALSLALQADTPPTAPPLSPELSSTTAEESTVTPVPTAISATETTPSPVIETPTLEAAASTEATTTPLPTSAAFTAIPRLTPTATFTPGAAFVFVKSTPFCDPAQPGLLQISLKDSNDQPAAGVELIITWAGGEEHFFSGLKPELGNGYADFVMSPNIEYALSLSNGATRVTSLKSSACTAKDGSSSSGGIHLDFKQP